MSNYINKLRMRSVYHELGHLVGVLSTVGIQQLYSMRIRRGALNGAYVKWLKPSTITPYQEAIIAACGPLAELELFGQPLESDAKRRWTKDLDKITCYQLEFATDPIMPAVSFMYSLAGINFTIDVAHHLIAINKENILKASVELNGAIQINSIELKKFAQTNFEVKTSNV